MNFHPFPFFETERLILRQMKTTDAQDLFEIRNHPDTHKYTDTIPDNTIEDTLKYINKMNSGVLENKWIIWVIEHKETHKVIGSISIWNINKEENCGELGFGLHPDVQKHGYMSETLRIITNYALNTLHFEKIEACTEQHNDSCIRLLERNSFKRNGTVDDPGYFHDRIYHMIVFQKSKEA